MNTNSDNTMRASSLAVFLAIATIVACKSNRAPSSDTTGAAAPPAVQSGAAPATPSAVSSNAGVTITSPAKGATTGKNVTVTMHSQGVTMAKADGKKVEGVGHYHLFLDTVPTSDNAPIPPTTTKIVHIGTGDSTFTFKSLSAGPHRIIAVIGYGDHSPMVGVRRDTVEFTVKP